MSTFWGEGSDEFVVCATEIVSTAAATAGFLLTAFGVIGVSALFPYFLACSTAMILMKGMHVGGLQIRKQESKNESVKKIMNALQNKEVFTGVAFGSSMVGASVLTTHSAVSVTISAVSGMLYPAQGLMALGFAINALVELYDNLYQWRELRALERTAGSNLTREGYQQPIAAKGKLAFSSLIKFLGWSCVITGSFAFALPLATLLISGGLAFVTSSHLYNNFFAVPRVISTGKKDDDLITRIDNNSARMGEKMFFPGPIRGLQVV